MPNEIEPTIKEIMDELIPAFEAIEAQSLAVVQFLEDKGIGSKHEFDPYLQQAAVASNVKWRAARLRLEHLFSAAAKGSQKPEEESAVKKEEGAGATDANKDEPAENQQAQNKSESGMTREPDAKDEKAGSDSATQRTKSDQKTENEAA